MRCSPETVSDGLEGHPLSRVRVRRLIGLVVLPVCVALVTASACSGGSARQATSGTTKSTATIGRVRATTPAVPTGTKVCGTVNALAGWPTTTAATPNAYACILDAFAAGAPAQMSTISGSGDSGRKTQDGHDIPTRRIVTLRVLGKGKVQVTTDLTEGGGKTTTKTCTGLGDIGPDQSLQGVNCL